MAAEARYWAVLAAAGAGRRLSAGQPKQHVELNGRTLLEHALAIFSPLPWISGIVVVLAAADREFARRTATTDRRVHTAQGGASRAESVLAGLCKVAECDKGTVPYVLVHDAARPCVAAGDLERLREQASDEDGGLLAIPVTDTLKRAEGGRAAATVERRELWRAQTPQLFRLDLLRAALEDCLARGVEVTDEARAMEMRGFRPKLVPGREANIKVTYPDDLALAQFWLARTGSGA